jgi:hypothetical protein
MDMVKERKPGRLKVPEKSTDCECPTCPPIIKSLWTEEKMNTGRRLKTQGEKTLWCGQGKNKSRITRK